MTTGEYLSGAPGPNHASRWTGPLAAVVVLLLGASVVGLVSVSSSSAASSPEAAVEKLFDAISDEDVLGMIDALAPGERDSLRSGVQDLFAELRRLEILSDDASLEKLGGVDFSFEGVTLSSTRLADDKASVSVTGGTARTRFDPGAFPFGGFLRDLNVDEGATAGEDESPAAADDLFVAVREDGDWYVSLWYTAAEAIRRGSGAPVPDFERGLEPKGADSAEAAVEDLVRAFVAFDLRRVFELLPPDEAAALHDYAPLFLDAVEAGVDEVRSFADIEITALEATSKSVDRGRLVSVSKLDLRGSFAGFGSFEVVGDCARFALEGEEPQEVCAGEVPAGAPPGFEELTPAIEKVVTAFDDIDDTGVIAVERGGAWYVSPTRSFFELMVTTLRALDRAELDAIVEAFEDLVAGIPS